MLLTSWRVCLLATITAKTESRHLRLLCSDKVWVSGGVTSFLARSSASIRHRQDSSGSSTNVGLVMYGNIPFEESRDDFDLGRPSRNGVSVTWSMSKGPGTNWDSISPFSRAKETDSSASNPNKSLDETRNSLSSLGTLARATGWPGVSGLKRPEKPADEELLMPESPTRGDIVGLMLAESVHAPSPFDQCGWLIIIEAASL